MKGVALALIGVCLIAVIAVVGYLVYQSFSTKVSVEAHVPNVPSFVDVNLFFGTESVKGLPTKFLDMTKEYYEFPFTVKNLFDEKVRAKVCPKLLVQFLNSQSSIEIDCFEFELKPNEKKELNIKIPIQDKKDELKNSTKTILKVEVEYVGLIKSLCDLYIVSGYPSCRTSKTSSLEISPTITPNPINLDKDNEFSVYLGIKRFSEYLEFKRVEITPIETKVRTMSYGKETVETITLEERYISEKNYVVSMPEDYIFLHTFNSPKIKVEEMGREEYIKVNCEVEVAKKLKICELRDEDERVGEAFKKLVLQIKLYFLSRRSIEENLFIPRG